MRLILFIISLAAINAAGQNNIYLHGDGDGIAFANFLQPPVGNNLIFQHASGDGFHVAQFSQTSLALNNVIFNHSDGDGFGFKPFSQSSLALNNLIFQHGNGDGFASLGFPSAAGGGGSGAVAAMETNEDRKNVAAANQIRIYPNPSNGRVTIQLMEKAALSNTRVRVFSSVGAVIYDSYFNDEELNIYLPAIGVYLIYVTNNDSILGDRVLRY